MSTNDQTGRWSSAQTCIAARNWRWAKNQAKAFRRYHLGAYCALHFADTYYNCLPNGDLNNKAAEIQTLIHGPWVTMESIAPPLAVFACTNDVASLTGTKRIKIRTPAGKFFIYVRRTMVYQKLNGQWKSVSGQGTYVLPRHVGQ